jgi:hypothetical protein
MTTNVQALRIPRPRNPSGHLRECILPVRNSMRKKGISSFISMNGSMAGCHLGRVDTGMCSSWFGEWTTKSLLSLLNLLNRTCRFIEMSMLLSQRQARRMRVAELPW